MAKPKSLHYVQQAACSIGRYLDGATCVDDVDRVTCKSCLEIINNRGLKSRSRFPEIPTFEVATENWQHRLRDGTVDRGCQLTFTCPVCGKENYHGGSYGHRVSHCDCWSKGYNLKEKHDHPVETGQAADQTLPATAVGRIAIHRGRHRARQTS